MKSIAIFCCLFVCRIASPQALIHKNNIVYGTATNWQNQPEELKLDLIYPSKIAKLPVVVYLHGGTFLDGSKEHHTKFCEQVAKKGLLVANVEYRQGFDQSPQNFQLGITQAAYRAEQDELAVLRWLIRHASDFPIDTSMLFIGGESAGGVASLLTAYVNQDEWEAVAGPIHSVLGPLNASSNDLNDRIKIKGVISLWGGIADTSLISKQDMHIPIILFQSEDDQVIPYERVTHPQAQFQTLNGSLDIAHRFKNNSACYHLYFIKGAKHGYGFSPTYMSDAIGDFVKNIRAGKCESNEVENRTGDVNKGLWDY